MPAAILRSTTLPASALQKKNGKLASLIEECAGYLILNDGPDEKRRAHPGKKVLTAEVLGCALAIAKRLGLNAGWQLYHFPGTWGMYQDKRVLREVIRRKGNACLSSERYGGSVVKLITEAGFEELSSPFTDTIGDKTVEVSMARPVAMAGSSPYRFMKTWLAANGLSQAYNGYREYHNKKAGAQWGERKKLRDEIIVKCLDQLLHSPRYDGDYVKLVTTVSREELFRPFTDLLRGEPVEISLAGLPDRYCNSRYLVVMSYVRAKKLTDLYGLRPWHLKDAVLPSPLAASENQAATPCLSIPERELLRRKLDLVLESQYAGNVAQMITEVPARVLAAPFVDKVGPHDIGVSANVYFNRFHSQCYPMLVSYLKAKRIWKNFSSFKPYHRRKADSGTWNDGNSAVELVTKKLDSILEANYAGNVPRMLHELRYDELSEPHVEELNGVPVRISMAEAIRVLGGNRHQVLEAYLEAKGLAKEYANFRPYHSRFSSSGTFSENGEPDACSRELLCRKCSLILKEKFGGDLEAFRKQVKSEDITEGFTDTLGGVEIFVSTRSLRRRYRTKEHMIRVFLEEETASV